MALRSSGFWSGKCVVITGSSSGIGFALAEHLAGQGAHVGLIARRTELLFALCERITSAGGRAAWAAADVTNLDHTRSAVRTIESEIGPCDVMIANAGMYRRTHAGDFDSLTAHQVVATNLQGAIHAIGAVLPNMVQRGRGQIAAVASIAGLLGLPSAGAYCAAKAGLVTLMRSLRLDLRGSGIKVTSVCPGFVDTSMLTDEERASIKSMMSAEDAARRIAHAIERGRGEYWFPRRTWLPARLASLLPDRVYQWMASFLPDMPEAPSQDRGAASPDAEGSGGQSQSHDAKQDQGDTAQPNRIG